MDQAIIKKLTDIVLANLADENFGIAELSKEAGISRSQMHRKLQSIKHQSVSQFIREIRLQRAKEMLQDNLGTASEIAFRVGFSSPTYFSKCFHDFFGYPPGEVKKRESLNSATELTSFDLIPLDSHKQFRYKAKIIPAWRPKRISYVIGSTILIINFLLIVVFDIFNFFYKDDYTDIFDKNGKVPIATMPFKNLTGDTTKDHWQGWIMDDLSSSLSEYPDEIEIRDKGSVYLLLQGFELSSYAAVTPSVAKEISKKLNVKIYITGSIRQDSNTVRISAQLYKSKTGVSFKPFEIDGSVDEIKQIADSLRKQITNFLLISIMRRELSKEYNNITFSTSPEAYEKFSIGYRAFYKHDFPTACEYLIKATEIDSNFVQAYILLTWSYFNQGQYNLAKEWCLRLYKIADNVNLSDKDKYGAKEIYALYFQDPNERIKNIRCLLAIDDENPLRYENLGEAYWDLGQYDDALLAYEKQLEIYKKWGIRPRWINSYYKPAGLYFQKGKYEKARKLYRKAEKDFPEMNPNKRLIQMQAVLALCEGKTKAASAYLEKFKSITGYDNFTGVANIYEQAGMLDSAEVYYRKDTAIRTKPFWLWRWASLLINNDINIEEGLSIIDESLQLDPNNHNALHTKAWGLFKARKYEEALEYIIRTDSLKPIYNSVIVFHKQEIEKAVARQENTN